MATDTYAPPDERSVTSLVSGIVNDAQTLMQQQLALFREEIHTDLRKTKEAVTALAAGGAVAALAVGPFVFMLIALLHELALWPWWASALLVGVVFAIVGGALIAVGVQRFRSFNPLPDQSVEALKENLQWIKHPK
ncbi:MAG TPA: phage holin family protein [Gemmataceae bacterium]|jgi:MFS family permease|nr:phage holin family protein [Gemmataceae bacterium]